MSDTAAAKSEARMLAGSPTTPGRSRGGSLPEMAVLVTAASKHGAKEGDYRDWDKITGWATGIAAQVSRRTERVTLEGG